jgi:hypothetical protein
VQDEDVRVCGAVRAHLRQYPVGGGDKIVRPAIDRRRNRNVVKRGGAAMWG